MRRRVASAAMPGHPARVERARRLLLVWLDAAQRNGIARDRAEADLASGAAARQLSAATRAAIVQNPPPALANAACSAGCAFCCVFHDPDKASITEDEARGLHRALVPFAGRPDGREWMPGACPSLDPTTHACRAYGARPSLCRSYVSEDANACRRNAEGGSAEGAGLLGSHLDHLDVLALARAALAGRRRVRTYSLPRVAAAAVEGLDEEGALARARQHPKALAAVRDGVSAAAAAT